jgi:hypothetical protein
MKGSLEGKIKQKCKFFSKIERHENFECNRGKKVQRYQ